MNPQDIRLTDWQRLLFGEAPPTFLLEVFGRAVVLYILLLIALRVLGKRMNGQLTITEMAVMIALGAIMGTAMQIPDRGLVHGAAALLLAVIFQRGLTLWEFRNQRVEQATQGSLSLLIADGKLQLEEMRKARVNHEQLFAVLREKRVYNLAEVERLYLEACGDFSLFRQKSHPPGLSVFPPRDEVRNLQRPGAAQLYACSHCGYAGKLASTEVECPRCHARSWTAAVA